MDVLAELPEGIGTTQLVFLVGLGLMSMILLVRSRRYFRQASRRSSAPALAKGSTTSKTTPRMPAANPPREFEHWEVAMHDLARELSGQLDSKIRVLELLIRQADEAAARLERARGGETAQRSGLLASVESPKATPREGSGASSSLREVAISPPRTNQSSERTNAKPSRSTESTFKIDGNPRFERVYALADAGMSVTTIANQIGSQVGEVELILSLRARA